jgi:hypothetical protein
MRAFHSVVLQRATSARVFPNRPLCCVYLSFANLLNPTPVFYSIRHAALQTFRAWDCIRGKTQAEISGLAADFNRYGKNTPGWQFPFSPRDTKAKLLEECRFYQLIHLDACDQDKVCVCTCVRACA